MTPLRSLALGLALGLTVTAAHASDSAIRSADERVSQQQKALRGALQSGDAVTIASERAKLEAARAVAWGRRHPAKAPEPRVAAR